jgi:hypothetical protein
VVRWQKTAPLGGCFRHTFHHTPTHRLGRFNLFLGSSAPSAQRASTVELLLTFSTSTLTLPTSPPSSEGTYFGSTSSVPKMDSSPSTLRIMACGIYRTVLPTGLRPLSSGVYSLFSHTHASSHERTTIAIRPCSSSSTLDRTRVP